MTEDAPEAIAIIGMAGRFPGAPDIAAFWRLLCEGRDAISRFSEAELEDSFSAEERAAPNFVRARGVLDGADMFDAAFFGMRPREAALTDPQHRIFLELCWAAFEDAGHDPARVAGAVGVFAGGSMPTYLLHHVAGDRAAVERFTSSYQVGEYATLVGALPDALTTRVSYKLGLRGPSMTIATACSTSLVAVAQACQALLLHDCDMALAGGVSVTFPQARGYQADDGAMVSPDGVCRPFDAAANGTVFSSGAGVVLLRRLSDALADGDHVTAIIRGHAVNNDGKAKVAFTAPSVGPQADVVAAAQAIAGFTPDSIGYVECHGTATPLGDPIEVAALTEAFRRGTDAVGATALGSLKGNVGHMDAAAGVAGLIKAALAVEAGVIPPTAHLTRPNPALGLDHSPFFVTGRLCPWPAIPGPRRAGVSALGVGGTNAHLCLEQAPPRAAAPAATAEETLQVTARSAAGLAAACEALADRLSGTDAPALADVAHSLRAGRRHFPHRAAVIAGDAATAAAALRAGPAIRAEAPASARPVVFLLPGQGAQRMGMGAALFAAEPVFRDEMTRCAALLRDAGGPDILDALYGTGDAAALRDTLLAQPALFAVEYALGRLMAARGVVPDAVVGHSVGEFAAAALAGLLPLADALALVLRRAGLMGGLPGGAMLAVRLPEAEVVPLLGDALDIAAVNGPALTVVAGPEDAVAELERRLAAQDAGMRRLQTSHAFHSRMMDTATGPLAEAASGIRFGTASLPIASTVTGGWLTDAEAADPAYWARHCRAPVRFADAVATVLARFPEAAFLELGPGAALGALARQVGGRQARIATVTALPDTTPEDGLAGTLARLWAEGVAVALPSTPGARRVPLPPTPFERTRHWIEAPARAATLPTPRPAAPPEPPAMNAPADPLALLRAEIAALIAELSGEPVEESDPETPFAALGYDSLFLSQLAQRVRSQYGVSLTFRQVMESHASLGALARHLATVLPAGRMPAAVVPASPSAAPLAASPAAAPHPAPSAAALVATAPAAAALEALFQAQLAAMTQLVQGQLAALGVTGPKAGTATPAVPTAPVQVVAAPAPVAEEAMPNRFARFSTPRAATQPATLTEVQAGFVADLARRLDARTPGSKRSADAHRRVHADPRTASGFRPEWKELIYPLVCDRAEGPFLWDVDGNRYIDIVNGYGPTAFGHGPDFVVDAVAAQLRRGFAIGPQSDLAGEVAALICELTGNERASFACTGSEAVMGAMRLARAVTGRDRIVCFAGAYHGGFDEVLLRGVRIGGEPRARPAAAGITDAAVANMTVLEYDDPRALDWIRAHAQELAAVLVEPVQSRRPGLQPRAFLTELRAITEAAGTALIFDEVVTGFRLAAGGAQEMFGIRADLVTYGKVLGGGLPIGVIAGRARFMDALDGGAWRFGDESGPETDVTVFAGTFVRHPLALAAAKAVLGHIKAAGPELYRALDGRTAALVARLDHALEARGITARIERCGSMFVLGLSALDRRAGLLPYLLRERGVHLQDNFPCFLTTAHGEAECDAIATAFESSLDALCAVGILGTPAAAPREAPLTEPQLEIWLSAQLGDAASAAFNESSSVLLTGGLDRNALRAAVRALVARRDALRVRFAPDGTAMRILPSDEPAWSETDLSALAPAARTAAEAAALAEEAETPFDLTSAPPIRLRLLRRGPDEHLLVVTAHHIVCDGWSLNVALSEIAALYAARVAGRDAALPPAPSFVAEAPALGADPADEAYWTERLRTPPEPLDLPADRPRPATKTFRGATASALLDPALVDAVKRQAASLGCTPFVAFFALFQVLMGRLAGQDRLVVGVPMAGQALLERRDLVGHCVNFLPIPGGWTAATTAAEHLVATRGAVLDARDHQRCTLGTIVRRLGLPRDPNRLPLTDVQFNYERLSEPEGFGGLAAEVTPNAKAFVNFDLFFNLSETSRGVRLDVDYATDLFDRTTIARWIGHYGTLAAGFAADPSQPVALLPLLDPAEREALAAAPDPAPIPDVPGFHQLFEAAARRRPDAVAVIAGATTLTYGELDERAERIARSLRHAIGTGAARVGVLMQRSADMLAALLGVAKAGLTYVPLDPGHPPARLSRVLSVSAPATVLVDDASAALAAGHPVLRIADALRGEGPALPPAPPARSAYVIFTSGSTGEPKGVEIGHRALLNLLASMARAPGFGAHDRMLAVTTIAFDIAALELFLPLSVGGSVVIADRDTALDGFALLRLLDESGATAMQATPSTWKLLLEAGFRGRPGLTLLCGGEPLPRALADRLMEGGGPLWNLYGPTETTIWSSAGRVPAAGPILIGEPVANTGLHVLDAALEPRPAGAIGELFISGAGLAEGYFRLAEETAARFLDHPALGRLYRTGDRARRPPDGGIELLGRADGQVKLRGFRIELGEIEAALRRLPGVADAAVLLRHDPTRAPRLVAYTTGGADAASLRDGLSAALPDYMVPAAFVALDRMPLTPNGKLDRKALPPPPEAAPGAVPAQPFATPLEHALGAVWQEVLGVAEIGAEDDVLALGADSIHLFQIVARARRAGIGLAAKDLLRHRTVRALAAALDGAAAAPAATAALPRLSDFRRRNAG
jgi:amino acid adenylation domain-containing protein